ncbi:MAG TPA: arabinofuranosidase catalytic domain-containing protein, partial [Polyangia bacterium]
GPLFQLGKASDSKAATLDVGQTSDHKADMTTWSAYCGGTQSSCVLSKIYAQIHKGSNDLLPAVWKTPWNPDCSAGGYTCAAKFTIESATGLPIVTTVSPQEYALSGDNFATGINGGSKAMGIMYNGKPVANQVYCCGVIGLTHRYDATDTTGTDFMLALAYGRKDSGGCCIATNCGASNKYCVGAEEEENNDMYDYGTSPVENAMVVTQYDPTANAVIVYLNGTQVLSKSPPKAKLNAGTAIHLGGGGDLSQPDPVLMREALFTNNVMSASEVTAMKANIVALFSTLKFP